MTFFSFTTLLCSCSSSKYLLSNSIENRANLYSSQSICYHDLLNMARQNIKNIENDDFIHTLSDLSSVQLFDTLDIFTFASFNQYIMSNIKPGKKQNVALFLNYLLAHKMKQATEYFSKTPLAFFAVSPALRALPVYFFRIGNTDKAMQYAMHPKYLQFMDGLTPFSKMAINIYQTLSGNLADSSLTSSK